MIREPDTTESGHYSLGHQLLQRCGQRRIHVGVVVDDLPRRLTSLRIDVGAARIEPALGGADGAVRVLDAGGEGNIAQDDDAQVGYLDAAVTG